MSLKVLLVSNAPWTSTGYGQQGASLARRLRDAGHKVTYFCNYGLQGGVQEWEGIVCLPATGSGYIDPILKGHMRYADPDLVITLHDLWPMADTDLPGFLQSSNAKWAAWFPVDALPVSPKNLDVLKYVDYPITMASFAEDWFTDIGFHTTMIPHGIEKHFGFTAAGRREFRRYLQVPEDAFLFGSVGRNAYFPGRKGFDRLIRAFSEADLPNSYLYIHSLTNSEMGSVPLPAIANFYGVEDRVKFADEYNGTMGYSKEGMNSLYSALDCYVQPTLGEGFGIPVLEAQACGAVVIATDCTSMPELVCPDASMLIPGITELFVPDPAHRVLIDIEQLKSAMREIYALKLEDDKGFRSMKARAGQWANGWDWDRLWNEQWMPFLAEVERERALSPRTERHRGNGMVFEHEGYMRKQDSTLRSPAVKKERDLLLTLDHPNILHIERYGEAENGTAWFDAKMLTPLSSVDVTMLNAEQKQRIIDGVESALLYLHERQLSHRDVCPDNVLVDVYYNPVLIDFEWAHPCEGDPCVDFKPWECIDRAVAIHQLGMEQRGFHTIVAYVRNLPLDDKSHGYRGIPYQQIDGSGERDCQVRWDMMKPDVAGKRVIDIGSNLGWFVRKSDDEGAFSALGLENDAAVLESARMLGGRYELCDLDADALPDTYFDVGFCLSVLQHLHNPDRVFGWMLEHCAELYIEIPSRFMTDLMAERLSEAALLGETERGRPLYRLQVKAPVAI